MSRKKVKLTWIANAAARKASLKKRRLGLLKKVSELATLCGVNGFIIIYGPNETTPMAWPSRPLVRHLLLRFLGMPELERCKKMTTLDVYLKERIGKVQDQSRKHIKQNNEMETSYLMQKINQGNGISGLNLVEMNSLDWLLQEKLKEIRKRIEYFQQVPPLLPTAILPHVPNTEEMVVIGDLTNGDRRNSKDAMAWDQWFNDLMNNNEAIASSSNTKNNMELPLAYNIGGNSSGGSDIGLQQFHFEGNWANNFINLGLPHGHMGGSCDGSSVNFGLPQGNIGENAFVPQQGNIGGAGMGIPQGNVFGNNDGNSMRMGFAHGNIFGSSGGNAPRIGEHYHGMVGGNTGGGGT